MIFKKEFVYMKNNSRWGAIVTINPTASSVGFEILKNA